MLEQLTWQVDLASTKWPMNFFYRILNSKIWQILSHDSCCNSSPWSNEVAVQQPIHLCLESQFSRRMGQYMITCSSTLEIAEVVGEFPFQINQSCVSQGHPFTRPIQVESHQPFKPKNPQTQGTNLHPTIYSKVNSIPPNEKNNGKHPDSHQLKSQLLGYLSSPLTPVFYPNHHTILTSNICVLKMDHDASKKRACVLAWQKRGGALCDVFRGQQRINLQPRNSKFDLEVHPRFNLFNMLKHKLCKQNTSL